MSMFASAYYQYTDLHIAAEEGDLSLVQGLVLSGASLTDLTSDEETAFHRAAWFGRKEVVQYLIELDDCPINYQNKNGYTALHMAAIENHEEVVRILLANLKCDVDIQDHTGCTALANAAHNGSESAVSLLVMSGRCTLDYHRISSLPASTMCKMKTLKEWLRELEASAAKRPPSLYHQCLSAVRQMLGPKILDGEPGLPLPHHVVKQLCLEIEHDVF